MSRSERPFATLGIDLDPVECHLVGYGVDAPRDDRVYERAAHRLAERLEARDLRATWFIVAGDARRQAPLLRRLAEAGHEIASHSVGHPVDFGSLDPEARRRELHDSRAFLEDAIGARVRGFRAPGWDRPDDLAGELRANGYDYDASSFPTPLLTALRASLWLRKRGRAPKPGWDAWRAPRTPHALGAGIVSFPVSTTPRLRIPIYHTLRYALGARMEDWIGATAARGEPLSYPLHGVDALGLEADDIDRRLAHHPGMRVPLDAKLALLERTFDRIARSFRVATFAERLAVEFV